MEKKCNILRMDNGETHEIIEENDRYYVTKDASYKKSNRHIICIDNRKAVYTQNVVVSEDEEAEDDKAPVKEPVKKQTKKKSSKKAEDKEEQEGN